MHIFFFLGMVALQLLDSHLNELFDSRRDIGRVRLGPTRRDGTTGFSPVSLT